MARRKKTTILPDFQKSSMNQGTAGGPNRVVEKHILGVSPGRMKNIAKKVVADSQVGGLNCSTVLQCPGIISMNTAISTLQLQMITALSQQVAFVNVAPSLPRNGGPRVLNTGPGAGTIYYSDGTNIYTNLNLGGGSGGDGGILYSNSAGVIVSSTTGDRGLASTGTGADKTYETSQEIDPNTGDTINMNFGEGGTVNFNDTDTNFTNGTTLNYDDTVISNHNGDTINYDGSTINSDNTTYNHTNDTINYDNSTVIEGGIFNNNTFNDPTFTGTGATVKEGPITWTPAGSSLVIVNANSTATSVVNGDNITSGTPNGNYFVYDTSTPGQITVTSKDFLGNNISENGIVFYYTITY